MQSAEWRCFVAAALILPSACAMTSDLAAYGATGERLELLNTAFFPAEDRYAAAAALATLLYTDGVVVSPDMVAARLDTAAGAIELQPALHSAVQSFDRVPYVLEPRLQDVVTELRAGRPVLVLLNLAPTAAPAWRYAVVIGYESVSNSLLLRSGREGRARMQPGAFVRAWKEGGNWAMVLGESAKIPATATPQRWIAAAESLSLVGKATLAETAVEAALLRWPEQTLLVTVALGNARYARMDYTGAESAYLKALKLKDDNPVVHNNLALVLLERRCVDLAEREVAEAIEHETDPKLREAYAQTDAKIRRYAGTAIFCQPPDADAQEPIEYDVLPLNPDNPRVPRALRKSPSKKAPK